MTQQILDSLQVVVRQLEDGFPEQGAVMVDWLTGDLQQEVKVECRN